MRRVKQLVVPVSAVKNNEIGTFTGLKRLLFVTIESNLKDNHLVYLIKTKAVQSSDFLAVNNSIIYFDWDNRLGRVETCHCKH